MCGRENQHRRQTARASVFVLIVATGLLLSAAFLLSVVLTTPARFMMRLLPAQAYVTEGVTALLSVITMSVVFALMFRAIPDIEIAWGDVWIGGIVTSLLFSAGRAVIDLYLASTSLGSPYAAAGSLIVFLTWVYYSAQIFLFGAAFTHVYALRHGSYSRVWRRRQRAAAQKSGPIPRA